MPNGAKRPTSCMRVVWSSFDVITLASSFDEVRIVELTHLSMTEMGLSFEDAFCAVVSHLHKAINNQDSGLA